MGIESPEFVIDGWVQGDSGRFTVIGRCGDTPIHVGETFDVVYHFKPRKYPEGLGDPPVLDEFLPVSLRVECIHAYDRSLEELSQCMTGSLVLRGEGLEHIDPGWVLGRKESLSVYA